MKRSAKWAVIRKAAPVLPWDSDPDAIVFASLAKRRGSAYALRMYGYACELAGITGDSTHTEEWRQDAITRFCDWMKTEHPDDAPGFARVLKLVRSVEIQGAFKASSRLVSGSRQHLRPVRILRALTSERTDLPGQVGQSK